MDPNKANSESSRCTKIKSGIFSDGAGVVEHDGRSGTDELRVGGGGSLSGWPYYYYYMFL